MRILHGLLLLLLTVTTAAQAQPPKAERNSSSRYEHCSDLIKSDPPAAQKLAQDWLRDQPDNITAAHCEAMAMYAGRQFAPAEIKLSALAARVSVSDPHTSILLSEQAAQAAVLAGNNAHAEDHLTDGLALATQSNETAMLPELLSLRAKLYLDQKKPYQALQDAEQGLAAAPANKDLTELKASALRQIEAAQKIARPAPKPKPKKATHKKRRPKKPTAAKSQ